MVKGSILEDRNQQWLVELGCLRQLVTFDQSAGMLAKGH